MAENSEPRPSALRGDSLGLDIGGARNGEDMNGEERDDKAKGPARVQKGREKNSLGALRSQTEGLEAAEERDRLRMGLKTKREGVIIPFGDLMREATRRAASVLFP